MAGAEAAASPLVGAVAARTGQVVEALRRLDEAALGAPSLLPHWSRLTIACHLRYGAEALRAMTRGALEHHPVSYYPAGRAAQRPGTLVPGPGERPGDVVASLGRAGDALHSRWASLDAAAWRLDVVEPPDRPDLGTVPLARLLLLRLTEVEVHGTDLDLGLDDWGALFVQAALPMRLEWLNVRRANHRAVDEELTGSWLLVAADGPTYRISVGGTSVESMPASPDTAATAVITASSRDLLALLLGRPPHRPPDITGDVAFGRAFSEAFPGP